MPVFDILGCKSIGALVTKVLKTLRATPAGGTAAAGVAEAAKVPDPKPGNNDGPRSLSHSQRRLWFLHKFLADKTVYNLLLVCQIEGEVVPELLNKTWLTLLGRHDVLRSRIAETPDGGLQQLPVAPEDSFNFETIECDDDAFENEVTRLTTVARKHVYKIEDGELVRCWLLRSKTSNNTRLFLGSHHLAWDRTSTGVVFDEISIIYQSLLRGDEPEAGLDPVPFQFVDYTVWQDECIANKAFSDPLVDYWKQQLTGIPEAVSLLPGLAKTDRRPAVKQHETEVVGVRLESALGSKVKEFCAKNALTPFMLMTASIAALVSRLTGDEDVVVGIADGDRGHPAFDRLVGFTVNMLPIRATRPSAEDAKLLDYLENFRTACLGAYEHRALPLDYLLQKLDVPRRTAHNPLFQIIVNYQVQGSFKTVDFGGFKFVEYDHYNARTQSDFSVDIEETASGELDCRFEYDSAIYNAQGMDEFGRMYRRLIEAVIETDGQATLESVQLASDEDQGRIAGMLQPPLDAAEILGLESSLFDSLFAKAVHSYPNKRAVVDALGSEMTWAELDRATNVVANTLLLASGARLGEEVEGSQVVGVYCEPGVNLIVSIFGILKAGWAYVAIQDAPEERIRSMMEDVEMRFALVDDGERASQVVVCGLKTADVFKVGDVLAATHELDLSRDRLMISRPLQPSDPICCIFTSGSTGRPKGIFLTHGAVKLWHHGYHERLLQTGPDDVLLLASAPTFDMSLVSMFGAVATGATLVVASREARYSARVMVDLVIDTGVSSLMMTPTQVSAMLTAPNKDRLRSWTSLKQLAAGGEFVPHRLIKDMADLGLPQEFGLWNVYGPSEATITVSGRRLTDKDTDSPLELPHFPAQLHILDEQMKPVPFGVPGELYIAGPGVVAGYLKRPELTEQAFVPNPFAKEGGVSDGVLYRTGDQFVLGRDGMLRIKGRMNGDRQVKIRGMRTELDEIETFLWEALESGPEELVSAGGLVTVHSVAVVYRKEEQLLVAYLATDTEDNGVERAEMGFTADEKSHGELIRYLRFTLRALLPAHMRPGAYVFTRGNLPSTTSGKTDYRAIQAFPAPARDAAETKNGTEAVELTPMQEEIANLWRQVLHSTETIGAEDFFSMGGHSLALVQIQDAIFARFGVTVALADMFADPTLEGMERLVKAEQLGGSGGYEDEDANKIDWEAEAALPETLLEVARQKKTSVDNMSLVNGRGSLPRAVAMTGASSMIGVHVLHRLLTTTSTVEVYCLAEAGDSPEDAKRAVLDALAHYRLDSNLDKSTLSRIHAYAGRLSHPTLGLSEADLARINEATDAIYHLASDVSLLGNADRVREGNLGAVRFLIGLAVSGERMKSVHYLSSWGVPHLQTWHDTELVGELPTPGSGSSSKKPTHFELVNGSGGAADAPHVRKDERSLDHIRPGRSGRLAYLKIRWACERMLEQAAREFAFAGLKVDVFRASMTGTAHDVGGLPRDDINRRIVEAALQTGMMPDFGGRDAGMSWITADFLAQAVVHLAMRPSSSSSDSASNIWHVVADRHVSYPSLATDVLVKGYDGKPIRVVDPDDWFAALKQSGNPDMAMHAAVLAEWWRAGWVPFALDAERTLDVLEREAGIRPRPAADCGDEELSDLLMRCVVGERGF